MGHTSKLAKNAHTERTPETVYEKRYIAGAKTVRSIFTTKDSGKRIRRKGSLITVKSREKRPDQLNEKNQLKTATTMLKARIKGDIVGEG